MSLSWLYRPTILAGRAFLTKTEKGFVENNSVYAIDDSCLQFLRAIACMFCHANSFATPWTIADQAPLSTGFSRQNYWSGLSCLSPGDLPDPGIKSASPGLQADSLLSEPPGKTPYRNSVQFSSVAKSCLTLCDPVNSGTPGLPVHHQLQEFTQTHVHSR